MADNVRCSSCNAFRKQGVCDLIHGGYWPLTPEQPSTYLDERLMHEWGALETVAPQLAAGAFLQGINGLSARYGGSGSLNVRLG